MANGELKGIDGWLLVFLALTGGLVPLIAAIDLGRFFYLKGLIEGDAGDRLPLWIVADQTYHSAITLPFSLFILWRMLRVRNWASVRIAAAGVWFLFVGLPLIDVGLIWIMVGRVAPDALLNHAPELSRGVIFALAGSWYLLTSRRVANTYRPHAEIGPVFD